MNIFKDLFGRLSRSSGVSQIPDEQICQMQSWSISAHLAAVPPALAEQVPLEVAVLINAAKQLHPQMALCAVERQRHEAFFPDEVPN